MDSEYSRCYTAFQPSAVTSCAGTKHRNTAMTMVAKRGHVRVHNNSPTAAHDDDSSPSYSMIWSARRFFRKRSGSPWGRRDSTAMWVLLQTGRARASNLRPLGVSVMIQLRRSAGLTVIVSKRRRCNGLRAAVRVVRSIPSSDATALMSGGSGRFRDIISENCPLVSAIGRSAPSKRRASALAARCT